MKTRLDVKSIIAKIEKATTVEGQKGGNFVSFDEPVLTELTTAFIRIQLPEFNTTDMKSMQAIAKIDSQMFGDLLDIALASKSKIIWKETQEHGRKAMIVKA